MRELADERRISAFLAALGAGAGQDATLYLTGGATAVLVGWRDSTLDVDVRLEPEHDDLLRRLVELKEEFAISVELASPADFIPELPGWRERSLFVKQEGKLVVRHFDPYAQALSKVERGFEQDLEDVEALVAHGLVDPARARELYEQIEPQLYRYPALDPASFRTKVDAAFPP